MVRFEYNSIYTLLKVILSTDFDLINIIGDNDYLLVQYDIENDDKLDKFFVVIRTLVFIGILKEGKILHSCGHVELLYLPC